MHINRLAAAMRLEDRREVEALGQSPKQALRVLLRGSCWSLTAMLDGTPHAMFGVMPVSAWKGQPWFLGTDEVYRHGREMLALGLNAVARMASQFTILENFVSIENHRAIRLLRRWGFSIEDDQVQVGNLNFHRFRMEA